MLTGGSDQPALAARRALVTGASRGLGSAIAMRLAQLGVHTAVTARSAGDLTRIAGQIEAVGGRAVIVPADLAVPGTATSVIAAAVAGLGGLDILVNNASTVEPLGKFCDCGDDAWERGLTMNLLAPARLSRGALRHMIAGGWGRLVTISSGAAVSPGIAGASGYSIAKAAIEAMTASLAEEFAGTGVTVNAVRPGTMDTTMQERMRGSGPDELDEPVRARYIRLFSEGRLTDPTQVAHFVVRLMQTDLNGRILDVRRASDKADIGLPDA